jgi:hypothetical protein
VSENTTTECLLFFGIFNKPTALEFDQRQGSSDGGAVLLKAAEQFDLAPAKRTSKRAVLMRKGSENDEGQAGAVHA